MVRKGIAALMTITLGWIILSPAPDATIILGSNIILDNQPSIILASNIILDNQPSIILADASTNDNPNSWLIL